jgi:predicted aminopeptidase
MHKRVPIDTLLADPHTSPALRTHLEAVRAARSFATQVKCFPI